MNAWRTGRSNPRNLYIGEKHVAVTVGPDTEASGLSHRIVAAMNHTEGIADCERACPDCHRCMCVCDEAP